MDTHDPAAPKAAPQATDDQRPRNMPRIAVLLPCHNEAGTIARVVAAFRQALPRAAIYVYDNNSSDDTTAHARAAGAVVRHEPRQGKGEVLRRMFADIDADIYVLADGDDTYDAASAPAMIRRLCEGPLDMVVGVRKSRSSASYRSGHLLGNRLLTGFLGHLFGQHFSDVLSGYRVLSRRFVKSFPAHARGFETESELSVHALELRMPVAEHDTDYGSRPAGSLSKLNTWRDGLRIGLTIVRLYRAERPLAFFSAASLLSALLSIILAVPLIHTWMATGLVPRFPTAILCTGLMVMAVVFLVCGLILDTVTRGRTEAKRLAYLAIPAVKDAPLDLA